MTDGVFNLEIVRNFMKDLLNFKDFYSFSAKLTVKLTTFIMSKLKLTDLIIYLFNWK